MTVMPSDRLRVDAQDEKTPPLRVLAVDDDPHAIDLYVQVLGRPTGSGSSARRKLLPPRTAAQAATAESLPHLDVMTCRQGAEAVEAVRQALEEGRPYSVAFVDMRMPPGPDGLWTATRIRQLDPDVNIVIVTAFVDTPPQEIARLVPPADKLLYIQKPFQPQEIQQFAVALSAKWHSERALRQTQHELEERVEERTAELARLNEELRQDIEERLRTEEAFRDSESRLRRQNKTLMELAHNKRLTGPDLNVALRELAETAAKTLEVDKVSIWLHGADGGSIVNSVCFERAENRHTLPRDLDAASSKSYLDQLDSSRTVAIANARTDERVKHLYDGRQAVARLDAPIRSGGRTVGFMSHEVVGACRAWTADEENFVGSLSDLAALAIEASERKRRDDALRQLKRAVEQSIDGISVTDTSGFVLFANRAWGEMHGYLKDELAGVSLALFHSPEQIDKEVEPLLEKVRNFGSHQGEVNHVRRDGTVMPTWMTVTLLKDEEDRPMGYLAIARDITNQKRAEERGAQLEVQLQRSQKMEAVGRLAGGIAHDFNNMLMAIIGCSEFLLEALDEKEPLRRDVEEIKKAGERAATLTRQLLAFSRRQVLQPRVLDLNVVVSDIEKMMRRVIGEDIDLVTVLDPHLGRVKADPAQLEQVIINLALNARDAMPKGGRLTLETLNVELGQDYSRQHVEVKPGPYVMLAVSDTGMGMDTETQTHIFEPFFTTKGPGKGTGLGLATVYGTIKQSDGYIWVYSEPGEGSTFKIYLPRVDAPLEDNTRPQLSGADLRGTETVLLVEDDEVVRDLVRRILRAYGYQVIVAPHARQALKMVTPDRIDIDIMLTDVVMPQMSGRELAKAMADPYPNMRVLYMSGYSSEAVVRHGMLDHGTPFLQKPFTPETLARKLREVLDHKP